MCVWWNQTRLLKQRPGDTARAMPWRRIFVFYIWQFRCTQGESESFWPNSKISLLLFVYLFHILEISSSVAFLTVAMRLFKRRVSDPAPQLVSLAAINSEMEQPAGSTRVLSAPNTQRYSGNSEDYADYQTVTAMPAMVVVDDAPRKGEFPCQLPSHDLF